MEYTKRLIYILSIVPMIFILALIGGIYLSYRVPYMIAYYILNGESLDLIPDHSWFDNLLTWYFYSKPD